MKNYRVWLLASLLAALFLRLYNLTYHSLWFDEAMSVHWARQSAPRIIEVGLTLVEDRLPPLYYLLLKGWAGLFGFGEFSVRCLSAMLGVLAVALLARLARMLFGRRVSLLAAWLAGLNPFLLWYSQETRMYAPALLFGLLAVWACLRFTQAAQGGSQRQSLTFLLLFVLFAVAGLYTHLYTGFVLPALVVWLVLAYPRRWRLWLAFIAAGLLVALAFAPLAIVTWRFSGEALPGEPFEGLGRRAWWLLQAFTVWKAPLPAGLQLAIPAAVIFFAAAAYLRLLPARRAASAPGDISPLRRPLLLVTLLLAGPFVIASLLLWRNHLAFFGERYFIGMAPWLLLLAATGSINLALSLYERTEAQPAPIRTLAAALLPAILLAAAILPLPGQWSVPAAKEAWRQSAAYLAAHAAPDHGILIHPDWVRYPFQYYFRGPGQTYAAFSNVDAGSQLDGPLQGVVNGHPVIWLIQSHLDGPDPERRVEQWFAARYPLVTTLYPPGISLAGYAPGYQLDRLPAEATPVDIQFEPGLRLAGYQAERQASARDDLFHPPSGWLHVILYWAADRPMSQDIQPYVNLVGPEGVWGASLERANDALHLWPTSRWQPGEPAIIRHDLDVNLNPLTPPGRYQLVVGLPGYEQAFPLAEVEVR